MDTAIGQGRILVEHPCWLITWLVESSQRADQAARNGVCAVGVLEGIIDGLVSVVALIRAMASSRRTIRAATVLCREKQCVLITLWLTGAMHPLQQGIDLTQYAALSYISSWRMGRKRP